MNRLAKLKAHVDVAKKVYNDYLNLVLNTQGELIWAELNRLAKISNDADKAFQIARWEAENQERCTCNYRTGSVCPACYKDNQERYGDSIPFGGE